MPKGRDEFLSVFMTTDARSPFIRRVLLNTATCQPQSKIPGLPSHPQIGAWDCVFDKLARDLYVCSSVTTIVTVAGTSKKDPDSIPLAY